MTSPIWPKPLVSTKWLLENLKNPKVRVLDSSTHLIPKPDLSLYTVLPAFDEYKEGHIPNAQFIDIEHELSTPHPELHFMLPSAKLFAETLSRLGINGETMVVIYSTTNHWWATRLWWTFKVFGHVNVAVLDGGFQKWASEKKPTESGMAATVDQGNYPVREANKTLIADKDLILERLNKEPASLINALRREQHEGRGGVNYGRRGHIKNSINLPAIEHVNQDNTFKSINELRTIFSETLKHNEVIAYCGGGIAATSVALALDMLGHKNVKVYDASLTEWASDETLPMSI